MGARSSSPSPNACALLVGVRRHQAADLEVGRALGGGEGADAEVHLAGAEREDPAVAGQHLALLAAELEVGADPGVVGHRRGDVGAPGHAVHRVAVPLAARAPCPAASGRRRPRSAAGSRPRASRRRGANTTVVTRSPSRRTSTARTPSMARAPALIAVVRRWSSSSVRATARAPVGQRAARPRQQQRLAEAVGAQALVDGVGAQPVAEAEPLELADRARGETVAAGLVAREDRRVGEQHVDPEPRQPGRRRRPRGPGTDDEDVGLLARGHAPILSGAPAAAPNRGPRVVPDVTVVRNVVDDAFRQRTIPRPCSDP